MNGGLLKSASAVAILAAAGLFANANAADLGGDCCADLEERVAELEATTVRKGNRKVSLTVSGFVGHQVMWWDDGTQTDTYFGDGGNIFSRFRFTGTAKITPSLTAGFTYEFGLNNNAIGSMNQGNGGDDLGECTNSCIRDTTVWLRHNQLGMVKIGQGSTATDNLILIDLGQRSSAATADTALYNGGFQLRAKDGFFLNGNWANAIRGNESFDTSRRNHVLYETPTLVGFTVQAAVAEDNYWDVALRYAGEFAGFRLAFGVGYQEDSELNRPGATISTTSGALGTSDSLSAGTFSVLCTGVCDGKTNDLKGSASILHVSSGLFLTGAAGSRELDAAGYVGPDLKWWYLSGGISQNFFGVGKTVLFGEYIESEGGLEQASFISSGVMGEWDDTKVTQWGIGITQHLDAAAMELFLTYKNYQFDGFSSATGIKEAADFQAVIAGTKINF